jgi:hypothetical protein
MSVKPIKRAVAPIWIGVVGAASLIVFLAAVQDFGSSARSTGIALSFWTPAVFTLLGALIAIRQPGNRIAWLLLGIGFGILVEFVFQLIAEGEPVSPSLRDYAVIVFSYSTFPFVLYLLFLIAFLFPTGHFFTHRQAWAGWLAVIMLPTLLLVAAFTEEIGPPFPSQDQAWTVANPIGFFPTSALDLVIAVSAVGLIIMGLGGVLSMITRYRQSELVVRTQIRWMLFATLIPGAGVVLVLVSDASQSMAGALILAVAFASVPLSITVAITRYRLFDIDRIISRTVTYTLVVGVLVAVYTAAVGVLAQVLPIESDLAVAAATVTAAALFNPLRRRIQRWVDRRFNRTRYVAERELETFTDRLRDTTEIDTVTTDLLAVVHRTLQPSAMGVWIRGKSE